MGVLCLESAQKERADAGVEKGQGGSRPWKCSHLCRESDSAAHVAGATTGMTPRAVAGAFQRELRTSSREGRLRCQLVALARKEAEETKGPFLQDYRALFSHWH